MTQLSQTQRDRLAQFGTDECIDMHCHCLPAIDDGPATMAEALELCRAIVADGVTTVVATAHQLGPYERRNHGNRVRAAVAELQAKLDSEGIPLRVLAGAEVRIDERIPAFIKSGEVLTLGGAGSHLLLELPNGDYLDPIPLIRAMASTGVRTIIAHPERLPVVKSQPNRVRPWVEAGALLQVTAASLTGQFGTTAEQVAWDMTASGLVALVAADAHGARRRVPRLSQAIELLAQRCGLALARRVCIENPKRILRTGTPRRQESGHSVASTAPTRSSTDSRACGRTVARMRGVL